jgi:hypothetical protein
MPDHGRCKLLLPLLVQSLFGAILKTKQFEIVGGEQCIRAHTL